MELKIHAFGSTRVVETETIGDKPDDAPQVDIDVVEDHGELVGRVARIHREEITFHLLTQGGYTNGRGRDYDPLGLEELRTPTGQERVRRKIVPLD